MMKKSILLAASVAAAAASATAVSASSSSQLSLQVYGFDLAGNSTPYSLRFCLKPPGSETHRLKVRIFSAFRETLERVLVLQRGHEGPSPAERAALKEKFAPRYDGLRFIETLVTAHR